MTIPKFRCYCFYFCGGRMMEASKITVLDIFEIMAEKETDVVNLDFEYDGIPARFQCKLTTRKEAEWKE